MCSCGRGGACVCGGRMKKYAVGGPIEGDPKKISAQELARIMAEKQGREVTIDGVMQALGDEEMGYTTAVESTARPIKGIPLGLGEPAMREPEPSEDPRPVERMDPVAMRGPRVIRNRMTRDLVGSPKTTERETMEREKASDDAIYFTPNTSNIRAYTRKEQTNPDAGYRTIGGEQDKFAQGFRMNGEAMYASPEVFELMKKEGVSPRDPYAIEFMKELAGKNPELFTKDNKYRGAINSLVMQEVYKDPTKRGFLLPADQPVIKASF